MKCTEITAEKQRKLGTGSHTTKKNRENRDLQRKTQQNNDSPINNNRYLKTMILYRIRASCFGWDAPHNHMHKKHNINLDNTLSCSTDTPTNCRSFKNAAISTKLIRWMFGPRILTTISIYDECKTGISRLTNIWRL